MVIVVILMTDLVRACGWHSQGFNAGNNKAMPPLFTGEQYGIPAAKPFLFFPAPPFIIPSDSDRQKQAASPHFPPV